MQASGQDSKTCTPSHDELHSNTSTTPRRRPQEVPVTTITIILPEFYEKHQQKSTEGKRECPQGPHALKSFLRFGFSGTRARTIQDLGALTAQSIFGCLLDSRGGSINLLAELPHSLSHAPPGLDPRYLSLESIRAGPTTRALPFLAPREPDPQGLGKGASWHRDLKSEPQEWGEQSRFQT